MQHCKIICLLFALQQSFADPCISSSDLTVCINSNTGNIDSIATKYGLSFKTIGSNWLGDYEVSNVLSVNVKSSASQIIITKDISITTIVSTYNATLNETISVYNKDASIIQWELNVISNSLDMFRTNISTQLNILNASQNNLYFWAPTSGGGNDKKWYDPLKLFNFDQHLSLQFGDGYLNFGGIANNNPVMLFPVHMFLSKADNHGIAFIYDMNDFIFGASLDINATYMLYQRYFNKISYENENLRFHTFIKLNRGFNMRDTLNWTVNEFPDLFYPISYKYNNRNISFDIGFGLYSCATAKDINATKVVSNSGANINWISSQWPPYFGMYTPPTQYNETWISNNGEGDQMNCGSYKHSTNISFETVNTYLSDMNAIGIYDLLYFNLFEYGQDVIWPLNHNTNGPNKNTWKNASEFLWFYLNDSIVLNNAGKSVGEWQHGILLDPNPLYEWGKWLINQSIERINIFGNNFKGISIDRQDHTREYNYNDSDEYSLCFDTHKKQYIECRSLLTSWKDLAKILTAVIHNGTYNKNAIITSNYAGASRIDLNMISDVIFSEAYDVNAIGLSSLMRPGILWTYSSQEIMTDSPHLYFQRQLYMNVNLMAPCIGNDHSILPDNNIQVYYNMYGNLFRALRGTVWWLNVETVQIAYSNGTSVPLINSFLNYQNDEMIFVLALGDINNKQIVNVNVTGTNHLDKCSSINPDQNEIWNSLTITKNTIVNNIVLSYGCAVIKCVS